MASTVVFRDDTPPERVPDLFYQTRKKLDDLRPSLPQGVLGPQVNDEYGDVYSVVYMLTADGLDPGQLKDVAEDMRQRLLGVPDVDKVDLIGTQAERIYVEFSHVKLATLGIEPRAIFDSLARQNAVSPAGSFETDATSIPLRITGALDGVAAVEAVPVAAGDRVFRLGDVATVRKGFADPPRSLVRQDGRPAIGLGVSMATERQHHRARRRARGGDGGDPRPGCRSGSASTRSPTSRMWSSIRSMSSSSRSARRWRSC